MRSSAVKLTLGTLFACAAIGASALAAAPERSNLQNRLLSTDEQIGSTIPYLESELGFNTPGLIAKVNVKDGDVIKQGQVLIEQDTAVEEAAVAKEEYLLKSNVQQRAAVAQRDLAKVELKRIEGLLAKKAASPTEYDKAKVELTIAELKIELADEETEGKRLDIIKLRKQIDRMQIKSPMDGIVRKVEASVGEVSDPQKPSITIVRNDKLKVEVKIPTQIANAMKLGQSFQVRYRDEEKWREAKVIDFDPVGDASLVGGAQLIHLEMPNTDERRAGQEMIVKMPQGVAAAK